MLRAFRAQQKLLFHSHGRQRLHTWCNDVYVAFASSFYNTKFLSIFQRFPFAIFLSLSILRHMQCENPKIIHHLPHIIDRGESPSQKILMGKSECQKYIFLPENDGVYERHFVVAEWAVLRAGAIVLWANMVLKMSVSIEWSSSEASLELLGLAKSWTNIEIDGLWKVKEWSQNVKLRVDQTNILLGTWARVRWKPVLEVATDSIEWGHSCKIHQISWEKLFYLESHGIEPMNARELLIEGEIMRHLNIVTADYDTLKANILSRI